MAKRLAPRRRRRWLRPEAALSAADAWRSPLGWDADRRQVRLAAPDADHVELVVRAHPEATEQRLLPMRRRDLGGGRVVWQAELAGGYYRFVVHRPWGSVEVADPWARCVARRKAHGHEAWAVAGCQPLPPPGQGGRPAGVAVRPRSVAMLEVHVGDWTCGPGAGVERPGSYLGAAEDHPAAAGGVADAVRMGYDAVELLPVAAFPLYEDATAAVEALAGSAASQAAGKRNHWGYMPSYLLAVSERYALDFAQTPAGGWPGVDPHGAYRDPARELAALIDALHRRGVAVIVDVVWNHVSLADRNPLLLLDPGDWFHREGGAMRSRSGCGNDLRSEAPEMRALLLAAVDRWVGELGCDGLRLDLAELIDDETLRQVRARALALRPGAFLAAEPWSLGGYRPRELAALGYAVWNDRSRDLVRSAHGSRPSLLRGDDGGRLPALIAALEGSAEASGGWLPDASRQVTYLECHDGWTLRDLLRLQRGRCGAHEPGGGPRDPEPAHPLATTDRRALQLAWALLCSTRGPILLHAGQAWGRSRRGADGHALIENAYDRDDAANHLDWTQRSHEPALVRWAAAWLAARRRWWAPLFDAGAARRVVRGDPGGAFALVALVPAGPGRGAARGHSVALVCNLDAGRSARIDLGAGAAELAPVRAPGSCEGDDVGAVHVDGRGGVTLPPLAIALLVPGER